MLLLLLSLKMLLNRRKPQSFVSRLLLISNKQDDYHKFNHYSTNIKTHLTSNEIG